MEPDVLSPKPVRVTIFNQTYTLLASEDAGNVEELAHLVDDLMSQIAAKAGNVDSGRVAVMACLHLADQFRMMECELAELKRRVDAKSKQFSVLLDRVME
ncbi:MAG: cell division protein ZapA [Bryobacteraceae bacterium]